MTGRPVEQRLRCHVEERDRCAVIRPEGVLGYTTCPLLRDVMLKCAIEQPHALIVDLSGTTIAAGTVLSVFTAVWLRISGWPAIPVLVVSGPAHAELLRRSPIRRYVGVFDGVEEAVASVDRPAPCRRAYQVLPHDPRSPGAARQFVRRTCAHWNLSGVPVQDAVQIASELVQNSVEHTLSEARLRLEPRRARLTVAVGDDDPAPVVLADPGSDFANTGRGVHIIAQLARTWGCVADEAGGRKTVWAVVGVG